MRPSTVLAASIAVTLLTSALPADAGAQDRARERERQREIERQRDRSLDLERRDDMRRRTEEARQRALEIARQYGAQGGGRTIITQPGGYAYSFGVPDDQPMIGISMTSDGMGDTLGVHVAEVLRDGPAERAGLRVGDRITSINGVDLRVSREDARDPETSDIGVRRLEREVRRLRAGDEAELRVYSGGQTRTVRVRTVEARTMRPSMPAARAQVEGRLREMVPPRGDAERRAALGISIGNTGSRRDTLGLMVMSVTQDGPAERAGLYEGDRIAAINGVDVRTDRRDVDGSTRALDRSSEFTRELARVAPGDEVTLRVFSSTGQQRTVRVRAGRASEVNRGAQGTGFFFREGDDFVVPSAPRAFTIPNGARVMPLQPLPRMAPAAPRVQIAPRVPNAPQVRAMPMPARPPQPPRAPRPPRITTYQMERAAPNGAIRRLENVDTIVRERVRAGAAPQVIRLNRSIVRI